jgi:hypothetical protein
MFRYFRPKTARRSGVQVAFVSVPLPTIAGTATTTVRIPTPFRDCIVDRASVNLSQIGASGGTVLATVRKHDASSDSEKNLTSALSLESDGVPVINEAVRFTNLGDEDALLSKEGDTLYCDVVASSTITTQPVGFIVLELLVQN